MLFEALLAFFIFGVAVTSIVTALHRTAELSQAVVHEQWIKQEAQNILKEVLTAPRTGNDFARDDNFFIDPTTDARILVEPLEAVDQDDNLLDELYTVTITIYWDNDGTRSEQIFSTVHYANMLNGSGQGGGR
jgi:Tfp pilus assembly protein PilV